MSFVTSDFTTFLTMNLRLRGAGFSSSIRGSVTKILDCLRDDLFDCRVKGRIWAWIRLVLPCSKRP